MKVLQIGDSMGEGTEPRLRSVFKDLAAHWKRGTMTSYWAPLVASLVKTEKPDFIIVLLGTNDANNKRSQAGIAASVRAIVDAIGSVPYLWAGPPASPKVPNLAATVETIRGVVGNHFFDTRTLSLKFYDGVHPTPNSFKVWADKVSEQVKASV
jgi:hypothetical protein